MPLGVSVLLGVSVKLGNDDSVSVGETDTSGEAESVGDGVPECEGVRMIVFVAECDSLADADGDHVTVELLRSSVTVGERDADWLADVDDVISRESDCEPSVDCDSDVVGVGSDVLEMWWTV